jgi:hypothetical protein
MTSKIGTTLYLGLKRDILVDSAQRQDLRYSKRDGFIVSPSVASDFGDVQRVIDDFCKDQIKSYIERGIAKLRTKKIKVSIPYTDGTNTFDKDVEMSVDDYLDATGFSRKLDYEIGAYEREWGINAIDPRKKIFTLFFNLNLIKYDDGDHIQHVVAHELAHVFFRDHDSKFQDALRQLDNSSAWSQAFFNSGISRVGSTTSIIPLLIGIVALVLIYWVYNLVIGGAGFLGSFFGGGAQF